MKEYIRRIADTTGWRNDKFFHHGSWRVVGRWLGRICSDWGWWNSRRIIITFKLKFVGFRRKIIVDTLEYVLIFRRTFEYFYKTINTIRKLTCSMFGHLKLQRNGIRNINYLRYNLSSRNYIRTFWLFSVYYNIILVIYYGGYIPTEIKWSIIK